jgi:hypothetical protein
LWSPPRTWSNLVAAVSPSSRHRRSSCKRASVAGMAVVDVSLDRIPRKKDCQFRMGEIPCRKGAEPIDRRDRLGRGTRRLHAPITLPDCIRPLLAKRFLKGGDP